MVGRESQNLHIIFGAVSFRHIDSKLEFANQLLLIRKGKFASPVPFSMSEHALIRALLVYKDAFA